MNMQRAPDAAALYAKLLPLTQGACETAAEVVTPAKLQEAAAAGAAAAAALATKGLGLNYSRMREFEQRLRAGEVVDCSARVLGHLGKDLEGWTARRGAAASRLARAERARGRRLRRQTTVKLDAIITRTRAAVARSPKAAPR